MFQRLITVYFHEVSDGRLLRLQYVGYALLVAILFFAVIFLAIFALGALETIKGGDLMQAQAEIRQQFGIPALIIFGVFMLGYMFFQANVAAKRARDTGLPGWIFVLLVVITSGLAGKFLNQGAGNAISALAALWLLFAPSRILKGRTS